MQPFRDIRAWQKAHELALAVYKLSRSLPPEEKYGLTSQIRRSAMSVATNIAEGSRRKSRPDFAHFLNMAEGSVAETDYLLLLAVDLGYVSQEAAEALTQQVDEVGRMLYALRAKVEDM